MDPAERVLNAVAAFPGAGTVAVSRALGVDPTTAAYHLRRLARRGLVTSVPAGRIVAHYASGCGVCPLVRRAIPLLGDSAEAGAVLRALLDAGPRGLRAASLPDAGRVGAVRWALGRSVAAGLAEASGSGRYALAPGADVCAGKVLRREACALWSSCAPGARHREGAAYDDTLTSGCDPSGSPAR